MRRTADKTNKAINNNKTVNSKMTMRRFSLVIILFVLWAIGIGARLVYLQTGQHEFLLEKAVEQRQRERKTKPLRGSIVDREGRELAITLEVESLWVDPTEIENVEATAYRLAPILGEKPTALLTQLSEGKESRRRFLWLARELNKEAVQKIRETNVPGLRWQKEQKRFYPHGKLAAQVIGFSNREDVGQAGIELTQDKNLRGEYNEITEERDGRGRVYESEERVKQQPRKVVLTLDYAVQYRTEQALAAGVQAARAKSGTAVVLNPKTGEILAMASVPAFDPNAPGEVSPELLINKASQNLYEPGSTFKLISYSAAIEEGLAEPNDLIDASAGVIKIGSREIRDDHPAKSPISLTDGLAKSSNFAAITMGMRVGKERLHEYIRLFGYGAPTGIELPAETRGRLAPPEKWRSDTIASISIGYEIAATTLQSAAAYATIANDGVRVAPHLIKEIQEEDGSVFARTNAEQRRVVSPPTAQKMRQMLEAVPLRGTGKLARIDGYRAAGKTGTAHKFDADLGRYAKNKIVASFVGFAPAQNPTVVIAVMIDEPSGVAGRHGGEVAAPIFSDIAEQVLPEMKVPSDGGFSQDEILLAKNKKAAVDPTTIHLDQPVKSEGSHDAGDSAGNNNEKNSAKSAASSRAEKLTAEKKNEKSAPNEPRQRPVAEKKPPAATTQKTKDSSPAKNEAVKTKNASPPKAAENKTKAKT